MKQVIVHVGYPKTATTTIQNSVFTSLHEKGSITYFGRSNQTNNVRDSIPNLIRNRLFNSGNVVLSGDHYDEGKINVFSDEELTSPLIYMQEKYGSVGNPLTFPNEIKDIFSKVETSNIKIVFILRKQADLIYSWYAQMYRFFIKSNEDTISKHVFENGKFRSDKFEMYDYYNVVKAYADVFGKENVHVELFENFKSKESSFLDFWSGILGESPEDLKGLFYKSHLNRKDKKGKNSVVTNTVVASGVTRKIMRYIPDNVKDKLNKFALLKAAFQIGTNLRKKSIVELDNFSNEELNSIKEHFRVSNERLVNEFSLSESDFKKYGYT